MAKPVVAVVGRPNVGKSTFVNRVTQRPVAIVHETKGVTRDRTTHDAEWNGTEFTLIDTGGIEHATSDDAFSAKIREQAELAIDEAHAVVFLVDSKTGITTEDELVARILKRSKRPVILAVNKCDSVLQDSYAYEFMSLGLGEPYPISSQHGNGVGDLLDDLVAQLPEISEEPEDGVPAIALIGRPNAGKSSLLNRLCEEERSIVSEVAGTTRDTVDSYVEHEGQRYKLVDTAGMRKRSSITENLEYYSYIRSERAIERADIALLVVDSTVGITEQDQRLAGLANEAGCGLIILLNKWDLITTPERREEILADIENRLHFVPYALNLRISALTGRSVSRIWAHISTVLANRSQSISTSKLNTWLTGLREFGHTVSSGKQQLKMNYITQTGSRPPVFTFFVNNPTLVNANFERYLENRIRTSFELTGTPVRFKFKKKAH